MKSKSILPILLFVIFIISCGKIHKAMCGEPTGERKKFIDSLNIRYDRVFVVEPICTYGTYLRINCISDSTDMVLMNQLDSLAYKYGYTELLVYDNKGFLIHGNRGSM